MPEGRYIRQETLPQVGEAGQAVLSKARVAVVGLGALGSASADALARSGVGFLRLIDRDHVELSNLQRSALYTEDDAAASTSKALAAERHLKAINSTIALEPRVENVSGRNILGLLSGVDLILDGSDNFELRVLVNEAADKLGSPWIYTGVLGTRGMLMPVLPKGPCFRCLSPDVPPPGSYPTCATAGVLATTTRVAASLQATLALKLLLGHHALGHSAPDHIARPLADASREDVDAATMLHFDVWEPELESTVIRKNPNCPVCGQHRYEVLEAQEDTL